MLNLTIDDKQVTAPKDATIYDAAKLNGINIPILCHDKKLKPFGACRMCLVEVEQMKGRQIPACTTPATEGMIIRTATPDIIKARKMVLELLLLNHPIDCPICDKAGDCDLQNLTYEYKVDGNRFTDEKFHHEIDYNNPLIERDMNRCVLCGKCARICDEIVSFGALTFIDRGIETKIGCEFDGALNCEFCGSCVSVCPVGSLLARPFKFKARFWSLTKKKSVCGYCGTGCNLTLGVKDNKVLTTVYDENQGFHNGQLCVRGRFGYQFINSDKRITKPMVRKNGRLEESSWDEAFEVVANRLKGAGNSAAALATPRLTNEELVLFKKLMAAVGSSNVDHASGYAHAALTEGFAKSFGSAAAPSSILDIQKSDLLLVIKSDAYETHPVVGFEINMAVKNKGVALKILSDKKGKLSKLPDSRTLLHVPGYEVAILNALSKVIIDNNLVAAAAKTYPGYAELEKSLVAFTPEAIADQCGLSAVDIKLLASTYARAEKALIILPVGQAYPGHNVAVAQAVANLALLAGKLGKEGSGVLCLSEKNNSQGAVDMGFYATNGSLDAAKILDGCIAGSIKSLFIAGENPLASYPDHAKTKSALEKVEFMVVSELFMTETAAMADVILPACSYAEKEGTFTAADRRVQYIKPAIKKVGQSKSDFEIFSTLITKLGGTAPASPTALFSEICESTDGYAGMSYNSLGEEGVFAPVVVKPTFIAPNAETPRAETGKLALLTGSALYHNGTLSLYGEGPMHVCPEGYVELSRPDAAAYNVVENDLLNVTSRDGSIKLKARISPRLSQGIAFAPYHFGINQIWNGSSVTWVTLSK
jgi:NADH-quinone oxidoreductase chain G